LLRSVSGHDQMLNYFNLLKEFVGSVNFS
jgi:hypothetical protein